MDIQLLIKGQGGKIYEPIIVDGIEWETFRKGSPSTLEFTVIKDGLISFPEGSQVQLKVDGKGIFQGHVFQKTRNKDQQIKVLAYDQLRYLKNKDTYIYTNKTATNVVRMIADDFNLETGTLEDTGYVIAIGDHPDKTLFDIILDELDKTVANTKKLFVLYDDFGKLTLKNIENMKLKTIVDEETAEDFDYASSIDSDTFNQIKIVYDNEETGKRDVYMARDNNNIGNWGTLQYYARIQKGVNGQAMADAMLSLKNRKTRNLDLRGVLGDPNVRAGCSLPVTLNLGDVYLNNKYLVCERVKHKFFKDHHSMDITLYDANTFVG